MTNEEAIAIIRNEYKCVDRDCDIERSCGNCSLMMPSKEPILEAYKLAIKALEQQPCERFEWGIDGKVYKITKAKDGKEICQQVCDDAINRDMALEKMADYAASGYADSAEDFEEYSRIICQLPSVTPKLETVTEFADRCRECGKMRKGHWIWNFDKGYCKCSECGIGMGHKEFDYCPNCGAKMQESEDKE